MAQRTLLHYLPDLFYPLSVGRSFARAACFFRARAIRPSAQFKLSSVGDENRPSLGAG